MAIAAQVSGLAHGPLVVSYAGDGWGVGELMKYFQFISAEKDPLHDF